MYAQDVTDSRSYYLSNGTEPFTSKSLEFFLNIQFEDRKTPNT